MALKICPSCFTEIPEEANACPHCHTELMQCEKCGALSLRGTKSCSKCGSKFEKLNPFIESPDVSVDTVVDHVKSFKKKTPFISFIANQALWSAVSLVLTVVGAILFLLTVGKVNFREWGNNETLMVLAIVLPFISYPLKALPTVVSEAFFPKRLARYTTEVGFNILPHLANGIVVLPSTRNSKSVINARKLNFDLAKTSEFAKANPGEYTKYMIINFIRLATIAVTPIGAVLGTVLTFALGSYISDAGNNVLTSPSMIVIYAVAVIEVVSSIALNLYMASYNKARDEWIKTAA